MCFPVTCANEECRDAVQLSEISELLTEDQTRRYTVEERKWCDSTMLAYCRPFVGHQSAKLEKKRAYQKSSQAVPSFTSERTAASTMESSVASFCAGPR